MPEHETIADGIELAFREKAMWLLLRRAGGRVVISAGEWESVPPLPELVFSRDGDAMVWTAREAASPVAAALGLEAVRRAVSAVTDAPPWEPQTTGGARSSERVMEAIRPLLERAEAAETRLAELENAITWNTSCTSCAATLDSAYAETARRETAEGKLAGLRQQAAAWAALAPPDDWGESTADTIKSDCGRAILAILGTEGDEGDVR